MQEAVPGLSRSVPDGAIIIAEEITPGRYRADGPAPDRRLRHDARRRRRPHRDHGALAGPAGGARRRRPDGPARTGDTVVVDGTTGRVIIDPTAETSRNTSARQRGSGARAPVAGAAARAAGGDPRRQVGSCSKPISNCRASSSRRWPTAPRARPAAHRIPLHEPRGPAGRGRAVRDLRQPRARHGRPAGDRRAPSMSAATSWRRSLGGHVAANAPTRRWACARSACRCSEREAAGHAARGDAARRRARAAAHPAADDLHRVRGPQGARGHGAGGAAAAPARRADRRTRCRRWA